MDAQKLVSRLTAPYLTAEDPENYWDEFCNEYPYFSHAHYLKHAAGVVSGNLTDIRQLSPFKQNPILFSAFIKRLEGKNSVVEQKINSMDEAESLILDEQVEDVHFETKEVESNSTVPILEQFTESKLENELVDLEDKNGLPENEVVENLELKSSQNVLNVEIEEELSEDLITEQTNVITDEFDLETSIIEKEEHLQTHIEPEVSGYFEQEEVKDDKSLMVMMSFMDWLNYFKHKTSTEQEEEKEKKALKTAWQKEKLTAIVEEEEEEIPENIFKQAMESISLESSLISESLAKLLAKQGKKDKAIDMYKKLSLRNPEKSAYFADLIKEINLNNN